jgi:hypothetical protein
MNKITLGSISFVVVASAALTVAELSTKDKVAGPEKGDSCAALIAPLTTGGKVECVPTMVHISTWSPAHPTDDGSMTPAWRCGNAIVTDFRQCSEGVDLEGALSVSFVCAAGKDGNITCAAEVRKPEPK